MFTTSRWNDLRAERDGLLRSLSGGLLFGIPLLYTMEVWWLGATARPMLLAVILATTIVFVGVLVRTSGFRRTRDVSWYEVIRDTTEVIAVSAVSVTVILFLLHELERRTPPSQGIGKVVIELAPFALGSAVSAQLLTGERNGGDGDSDGDSTSQVRSTSIPSEGTLRDLGATIVGAVFVAFNIAPTDEIPMLASSTSPPSLIGVVIASIAISYVIVFSAGFGDQDERRSHEGLFQHPITETLASYLVSLALSAAMLAFFGRFRIGDPPQLMLEQSVMLALPASVGAAAGRLAV